MMCVLYFPRGAETSQVVCILYQGKLWSVEYDVDIKPQVMYFHLYMHFSVEVSSGSVDRICGWKCSGLDLKVKGLNPGQAKLRVGSLSDSIRQI